MMSKFETFKKLHYGDDLFLLPNAWDARSAKVYQENGFAAVGTSSMAIANMLGSNDGENLSFEDLLFVVRKITDSTDLMLSVDIEGGYSRDPAKICEHLEKLFEIGIVGINIEDSVVENERTLTDTSAFAQTLERVKNYCVNNRLDIFFNVRTDAYLLGIEKRFAETRERIGVFERAGADGIFVPCLTNLEEIKSLCGQTNLPINVLSLPDLPNFDELSKAGVKRVSIGNFMFDYLSKQQGLKISEIRETGDSKLLF